MVCGWYYYLHNYYWGRIMKEDWLDRITDKEVEGFVTSFWDLNLYDGYNIDKSEEHPDVLRLRLRTQNEYSTSIIFLMDAYGGLVKQLYVDAVLPLEKEDLNVWKYIVGKANADRLIDGQTYDEASNSFKKQVVRRRLSGQLDTIEKKMGLCGIYTDKVNDTPYEELKEEYDAIRANR